MTPEIIPAMDVFLFPDKFKAFQAPYQNNKNHIDAEKLSQFFITLQRALSPIERHFAKCANRPVASIRINIDTGAIGNFTVLGLTEQSKSPLPTQQGSRYLPEINTYLLGYKESTLGLQILGELRHEAEHAYQYKSKHSSTEKRMYKISQHLYDRGEHNPAYRNNYTEIKARIAESKFYIQACEYLLNTNPTVIQNNQTISFLKHKQNELLYLVSLENMTQLNQRNIQLLQNSSILSFIPFSSASRDIIFLKQSGMLLYQKAFNEANNVATTMTQTINVLTDRVNADSLQNKKIEQQQDRNKMYDIASQYPMISQLPIPLPKLQFAAHNSRMMQQSLEKCAQLYNVAIYHDNQGNFTVIADTEPTPREYSANPQLKEKWDQLHPELLQTDNEYSTEDLVFDEDR